MSHTIFGNYIDGKPVESTSPNTLDLFTPSTGKPAGKTALSNLDELHTAIASAKDAFEKWSKLSVPKRQNLFFALKNIIQQNEDALAFAIGEQHGKILHDAKGEIARGMEILDFCCGISTHLKGEYSRAVGSNINVYDNRYPLGVVGCITPFNFPIMVPMWMTTVAIACGNTVILKPSEKTPKAALMMADFYKQAGFPDGVFNVVNGDKTVVDGLIAHPDVPALSFVGSTPIAEYIYKQGCANNKRVQALGGAKNHCIVMPDANLNGAANAISGAGFGAAGERCMALSVALCVGDDVGDKMVELLSEQAKNIKIGSFENMDADMGAVISAEHRDKINGYIDSGVAEGAKLVVDGRAYKCPKNPDGYYVGATLFDNVTTNMKIYQEEIFGPVLAVVRVKSYEEALDLIKTHAYGNGTAIFTSNGNVAHNFVEEVNVGMVGVNVPIPVPVGFHSFGGWKASLFGTHSIYGKEGVHFYTKLKTVTQRWGESDQLKADFFFPTN